MKITIYELLGMVKDSKAPKKIKYNDTEYYLYDRKSYLRTDNSRFFDSIYFKELNEKVEILEEEKKIPEKLGYQDNADGTFYLNRKKYNSELIKILSKKMNEIIDYLDYLKSKGDE